MTDNKNKLLQLIKQLDPQLVGRVKNGQTIRLSDLLHELAQEHILKNQKRSHTSGLQLDTLTPDAPGSNNKSEDASHHQYDSLTGLPNRSFFNQSVDHAIKRASRHNKPFALIFIDIDHFKTINDTHGHQIGDNLLKQLSNRILNSIRQSDVLCRHSGDEFCLLVEELDKTDAILRIVDSIREHISLPFELHELSLIVTTSMGVSVYPEDGKCFQDLLHFADLAMYEAKRSGRNCVSIFTPEVSEKVRRLNLQQKRLKTALQSKQLEYRFQPELELKNGDICGIRQLASLPIAGLESEKAMLETAHRSKQATMLNMEILRNACEVNKRWKSQYNHHPRMVVPLFKDLLSSPRCHQLVRDLIQRYLVSGSKFEFEIEESDLNNQCDNGFDTLKKLYLMGCKNSLINFGIGPSSLRLLSSGYIHKIKIDGTLIHSLESSAQSRNLMEAIITICDKFKIRTVGLDVASSSQIKLLQSLGCDGIRGDYLSAPITIQEIESVLNGMESQLNIKDGFLQDLQCRKSGIPPPK